MPARTIQRFPLPATTGHMSEFNKDTFNDL